jgi:hypothetical protein
MRGKIDGNLDPLEVRSPYHRAEGLETESLKDTVEIKAANATMVLSEEGMTVTNFRKGFLFPNKGVIDSDKLLNTFRRDREEF